MSGTRCARCGTTEASSYGAIVDTSGRRWRVSEDALIAEFDDVLRLPRVAAHRAFWFGWFAQFPDTRLIK